jgi:hypothetical protein
MKDVKQAKMNVDAPAFYPRHITQQIIPSQVQQEQIRSSNGRGGGIERRGRGRGRGIPQQKIDNSEHIIQHVKQSISQNDAQSSENSGYIRRGRGRGAHQQGEHQKNQLQEEIVVTAPKSQQERAVTSSVQQLRPKRSRNGRNRGPYNEQTSEKQPNDKIHQLSNQIEDKSDQENTIQPPSRPSSRTSNTSEQNNQRPKRSKKKFLQTTTGGAFSTQQVHLHDHSHKRGRSAHEEIDTQVLERLPLTERLIKQLEAQSLECAICIDRIRRQAQTWSCEKCFTILHLSCAQKWAREKATTETDDGKIINKNAWWPCPQCRNLTKNVPSKYYCFCKKLVDPENDMFITPHSCGEQCSKQRTTCPHECIIPCHPGPCPPCSSTHSEVCHCGKESFVVACSGERDENGISCGQICDKFLNCKRHRCEAICHPGECNPCMAVFKQGCYCGKKVVEKLCEPSKVDQREGDLICTFSCEKLCGKVQVCGHGCDRVCHPGTCITQKRAWAKTEEDTTDILKSYVLQNGCNQACRKTLSCGHKCLVKCHPQQPNCDALNACQQQVEVKCECGRLKESMDCRRVRKLFDEKMKKKEAEFYELQKLEQDKQQLQVTKSKQEGEFVESKQDKPQIPVEPPKFEIPKYSVIGLPSILDCDKECRRIRRIKQLANAFEIDFEKREMPEYSEPLQYIARRNLQTLFMVERVFDELILLNPNERASYQFPRMNKERRQMIHELAEIYGMEAQSIDPEPYRSVVVMKSGRSTRPMMILSDVIQDPNKEKVLREKLKEKKEQEEKQEAAQATGRKVYENDRHPKVVEFEDEEENVVTALPKETNIQSWKDVQVVNNKENNFWAALDDEDQ